MTPPRKPLFLVPVRDRRQRRRILTIRNCAITLLSLAVVFAAISIASESRKDKAGDYGRLFGSQVGAPHPAVSRNVEVVKEGSVGDQAAPDPMLVAPAAGEQLLMAKSNVDPAPAPVPLPVPMPPPATPAVAGVSHGTAIVGDGNGVFIARAPASSTAPVPAPVLSGGIFKEH